MKSEIPKPVIAVIILLVVGLVVFVGMKFTNPAGDLSGKTYTPKPWGPPGGAAKFQPGAPHGAPAQPPANKSGG